MAKALLIIDDETEPGKLQRIEVPEDLPRAARESVGALGCKIVYVYVMDDGRLFATLADSVIEARELRRKVEDKRERIKRNKMNAG